MYTKRYKNKSKRICKENTSCLVDDEKFEDIELSSINEIKPINIKPITEHQQETFSARCDNLVLNFLFFIFKTFMSLYL